MSLERLPIGCSPPLCGMLSRPLATGGSDQVVRLWQVAGGEELCEEFVAGVAGGFFDGLGVAVGACAESGRDGGGLVGAGG